MFLVQVFVRLTDQESILTSGLHTDTIGGVVSPAPDTMGLFTLIFSVVPSVWYCQTDAADGGLGTKSLDTVIHGSMEPLQASLRRKDPSS